MVVRELSNQSFKLMNGTNCKVVASRLVYDSTDDNTCNHLWVVKEISGVNDKGLRIVDNYVIVLYLLKKESGCWGYKGMEESCEPFYYDCPLEFLEYELNYHTCPDWRKAVKAYHFRKNPLSVVLEDKEDL